MKRLAAKKATLPSAIAKKRYNAEVAVSCTFTPMVVNVVLESILVVNDEVDKQ